MERNIFESEHDQFRESVRGFLETRKPFPTLRSGRPRGSLTEPSGEPQPLKAWWDSRHRKSWVGAVFETSGSMPS